MSEILEVPAAALPLDDVSDWQALPPAAAQVAMIAGTALGALLGVCAAILIAGPLRIWLDYSWLATGGLAALAFLACILAAIWLAYRRWQSSFWKLDGTGLHVKRGRAWRKEILIPRSRVQHLDIERGPIERHFGLATLIVHTAGTRTHALRQAGLPDADAVALRDALVPASDRHDDVL